MMDVHERKIAIATGDRSLAGTLISPGTLIPGVLFVHGWNGSQQQYLARAREVAALGSACLAFDLGGHAGTEGEHETVSRESNLRDLVAAYDVLVAHPQVDPSRIAVIGSSYGGYLGAILTELRQVHWLVLRAPALYRDSGWGHPKMQLHREQNLEQYRRNIKSRDANRALHACSQFKGDVLIVESEHDDRIPHAVITSYRDACTAAASMTHKCLAGADHGLTTNESQQAYTALLLKWLADLWPDARRGSDAAAVKAAITDAAAQGAVTEPEAPPSEIS
jgi:dienelactone hydrolase